MFISLKFERYPFSTFNIYNFVTLKGEIVFNFWQIFQKLQNYVKTVASKKYVQNIL